MKSLKKVENYKIFIFILFVLSIIYVFLYLRPSVIDFDENYTLSLIGHSYEKIIYLDALDVHPPLYYFLVKIFIEVTTFWTNYFPIKILSARIFSIIISVITFFILVKICHSFNIFVNKYIGWILFVLLPNVLGFSFPLQQLTNIRMYSLAALFIVIEFYYLLKYSKYHNKLYFIIIFISAVCAAYTHYYSAIFAGLLILFYFIRYIFCNDKRDAIRIFILGALFFIAFVPWIPILLKQIKIPETYWMTNIMELKEIVYFFIALLLFSYPIICLLKNCTTECYCSLIILISTILTTFLMAILYTIIKGNIFQYRYMFPILIIYEFIGISYLISQKKNYRYKMNNWYCICLLLILFSACGFSINRQIHLDVQSFNCIRRYNKWNNKSKAIYITHGNGYDCNNDLTDISVIRNRFIISRRFKASFKNNIGIYRNNTAYKELFKKDINRIYFKSR